VPGDPGLLAQTGFVAQDTPLYRDLTVAEHLTMGRKLNPRFDQLLARGRLERLGIALDRRAGTLSGGQRAQVALAMALAKRPELLLLDEPLAALDPLARREFLQALMGAVAEQSVTVVLSSHLLADLERVCDYLIVLSAARVQVLGPVTGSSAPGSTAPRGQALWRDLRKLQPHRLPTAIHHAWAGRPSTRHRPVPGRLRRRRLQPGAASPRGPLLAVPGRRDRSLRRPGRGPAGGRRPRDPPPHRLTGRCGDVVLSWSAWTPSARHRGSHWWPGRRGGRDARSRSS